MSIPVVFTIFPVDYVMDNQKVVSRYSGGACCLLQKVYTVTGVRPASFSMGAGR